MSLMSFMPPTTPTKYLNPTLRLVFVLGLILAVSGCAKLPESERSDIRDPYEPYNRLSWAFNLEVDDWVLEPTAKGYRTLPQFTQDALTNFVDWTGQPATALNSALQGRGENAMLAVLNFIVNGVTLGLADLTKEGDDPDPTNFGDTLAAWYVPSGSYLMMPFIGPGTTRSHIGFVVDIFTDPLGFATTPAADTVQLAATPIGIVTARGNNFDLFNDIKYNSLDPYARSRSLYFQFANPDGDTNETQASRDEDFDAFLEDQ